MSSLPLLSRTLSLQDEITVRTIDVTQIDNLTDPLFNSCYDYYYYYWYTYLFQSSFFFYFMQYDSPRTLLFLSLFNCPRLRHYCSTPPTLSSFPPLTLTLTSLILLFFSICIFLPTPSDLSTHSTPKSRLSFSNISSNLSFFFRSLFIFSHALFLLLFLP